MRTALFPGSFDPPTLGHLDIIRRTAALFDKLYIGIATNTTKTHVLLSVEEKIKALKACVSSIPNIEIIAFHGLVIDLVKEKNIDVIIRGIRTAADFELESQMAAANLEMSGIETLMIQSRPEYTHLSSTLIREIAHFKGPLEKFVPQEVIPLIFHSN